MTAITPPASERAETATLGDGRTCEYRRLGAPDGPVVVVLDGPGSRGLGRAASAAAHDLGVTLLVPDRPGFGRSSPAPDGSIVGIAEQLRELVDVLGIGRFGVLGQSGGTPYALALAALTGDRCTGVAFTGAITPLYERDALDDVFGPMRRLFVIARRAPWLLRPLLEATARQTRRDPQAAARRYLEDLPSADRAVLADPRMQALHERSSTETLESPAAFVAEVRRLVRPWDVDLARITAPVALWAGELDGVHPPVMSRRLADRLGGAPVTVIPEAATFGLAAAYGDALVHAAALPGVP